MAESRAAWERRLLNRLTAIRLANQILERRTELSEHQRQIVRVALEACNDLVNDVLPGVVHGRPAAEGEPRGTRLRLKVVDRPYRSVGVNPEHAVDAVVIAPDLGERCQVERRLAEHGYVAEAFDEIDGRVEQLLAVRRRLVVLCPDGDVGWAEIAAQVRRLRSLAPRAALLLCLDGDQARSAEPLDAQTRILRRPVDSRRLLEDASELYPVGPPRRATAVS